jgi:regulator of replication initiation timing
MDKDELLAENARLKAEIEMMKASSRGHSTSHLYQRMAEENARLKAEVERLRLIGDEIIMDVYRSECLTEKWCKMARKWDAAKEGKQSNG